MEHIPKYELILRGPKASFVLGNLTRAACFLFKPIEFVLGVTTLTKSRLGFELPQSIKYLVVMGCGFSYRGGSMLKSRCASAATLYKERPDLFIVLSGADRPGHSETGFMKNYLLGCGIPEEKLICDGKGINSLATFQNCKTNRIDHIAVCSNDFHIPRCVFTARKLGLDAYGVPNPPNPDPAHWRYWLREKAALCRYAYLLRKNHECSR